MKGGGLLLLALVAWIAYQAGQSAGVTQVLTRSPYPGAASPGY